MSLYVASDLHIRGSEDPLYQSFLAFLRARPHAGDTLILAGDVFDLFVGNKPVFMSRYAEFFVEIRRLLALGVDVHYIEGNHDFLMKRPFAAAAAGAKVHPREVSLEIGGKRFFFAHGDLANRKDYGYLALRAFYRSPPLRAFVRLAPGSWIEGVGKKSSHYTRGVGEKQRDIVPNSGALEKLRRVYRSFAAEKLTQGYDFVVMGHCHDLDEMDFRIGGRPGQYINVGYPRVHGSYLTWVPGEAKITREPLCPDDHAARGKK